METGLTRSSVQVESYSANYPLSASGSSLFQSKVPHLTQTVIIPNLLILTLAEIGGINPKLK